MIKRIEKYSAEWCGPCQVLAKTIHNVLQDYPDIELVEYDADNDEEKFEEKLIKNIPQLYFYDQDGTEVHHLIGAHPANKIKDIIDYHNKTVANYNPYNAKYVENRR